MRLFDPEEWRRVSDAEERSEAEVEAARAAFLEAPTESNRERYAAAVRASVEAHDSVLASIRETSWDGRPEIRRYGQGAFDGMTLHSDADLVARLHVAGLPEAIVDHLVGCTQKAAYSRCLEAMRCQPDEVTAGVRRLIDEAAKITGLSNDELIGRTDFDPADLIHDRLDAAFAELRAVVWLRDEGFSDIRLVRGSQKKGQRRTDLLADRDGETYAFDVACSSAGAERRVPDLRA